MTQVIPEVKHFEELLTKPFPQADVDNNVDGWVEYHQQMVYHSTKNTKHWNMQSIQLLAEAVIITCAWVDDLKRNFFFQLSF